MMSPDRKRKMKVLLLLSACLLALAASRPVTDAHEKWKKIYRYDPAADYRYTFIPDASVAGQTTLPLHSDHFLWPEISGDWDTAFLEVRIESGWMGTWLEPEAEIRHGSTVIRQYFERGASGIRYLNVSPLIRKRIPAGGKVGFRGKCLDWSSREGRLFLFRNRKPEGARILVIAPHPDDAEIAAFGFYSHKDSHILTITAGEEGLSRYAPFFSGSQEEASLQAKGRLRIIDSITVPMIGGIPPSRSMNLGYFDNTLQGMHASPDRDIGLRRLGTSDARLFRRPHSPQIQRDHPAPANWRSLLEELTAVLDTIRPEIIVAPHPLLDAHPDHRYASLALLEAIGKAGLKEGRLYLYTNHLVGSKYYPYGPPQGIVTLPPWLAGGKVKGIYSHELTMKELEEKRFALEAMRDLRTPPLMPSFGFADLIGRCADLFYLYLKGVAGLDNRFFRKAIRPNELFFVYPCEDAAALKDPSNREGNVLKK
jgi:LmbE family N-acetylglucosaminyl deacetylase